MLGELEIGRSGELEMPMIETFLNLVYIFCLPNCGKQCAALCSGQSRQRPTDFSIRAGMGGLLASEYPVALILDRALKFLFTSDGIPCAKILPRT